MAVGDYIDDNSIIWLIFKINNFLLELICGCVSTFIKFKAEGSFECNVRQTKTDAKCKHVQTVASFEQLTHQTKKN